MHLCATRTAGYLQPWRHRARPRAADPSCMRAEHSENLLAVVFIDKTRWRRWRRRRQIVAVPKLKWVGLASHVPHPVVGGIPGVAHIPNPVDHAVRHVGHVLGIPWAPVVWAVGVGRTWSQ